VVIDPTSYATSGPLVGMIYTGGNAANAYNGPNPRLATIGNGPINPQDADFPAFSICRWWKDGPRQWRLAKQPGCKPAAKTEKSPFD